MWEIAQVTQGRLSRRSPWELENRHLNKALAATGSVHTQLSPELGCRGNGQGDFTASPAPTEHRHSTVFSEFFSKGPGSKWHEGFNISLMGEDTDHVAEKTSK